MPPPKQYSENVGNAPEKNIMTALPASALKHLEPSPGGQWMCREYQGSLHVAYNVVGNLGTYHYLVNPCATEKEVHEHCKSYVYEFPGVQRNHEEVQRYEFPDRFNPKTRATPTMQVVMEPQVLALNNLAQASNNFPEAGIDQEHRRTETFHAATDEAPASSVTQDTMVPTSSMRGEGHSQTEILHDNIPQELVTVTTVANPTSWPFEDETMLSVNTAVPGHNGDTNVMEANMIDGNNQWIGNWDATEGLENGGGDFGWMMSFEE